MNIRYIAVFAIVIAGACSSCSSNAIAASQLIDYQVNDNTYAVVVPQDSISSAEAKRLAHQRAAEMSVSKGYRYFTIESEQEVQVIKSNKEWPNSQDFPGNLYQELIIENNFGKESLQRRTPPSSSLGPAYRLVFRMQGDRPSRGSIDACTLTECDE